MAELRARRCHGCFPLSAPLAPHEQRHQLRLPLLHGVLVLAVQNHVGSTAVAGRRRLRPPVHMAGPPRAASRPSETTSGRERDPWSFPATPPPPVMATVAGATSQPGSLCCRRKQRRRRTSRSNWKKVRGLSEESVTQMNSVVKDLLAGNLLNFRNS